MLVVDGFGPLTPGVPFGLICTRQRHQYGLQHVPPTHRQPLPRLRPSRPHNDIDIGSASHTFRVVVPAERRLRRCLPSSGG